MKIKQIIIVILMLFILLSGCSAPVPPQLLSTPDEIFRTIEPGMEFEEVIGLINPQYGKGTSYFVNCEFIVTSPTIIFSPTSEALSWHFILFFMPEVSKEGLFFMPKLSKEEQPTAVFFHYDDSKNMSSVIAVDRFDYEKAEALIRVYGTPIIWGD